MFSQIYAQRKGEESSQMRTIRYKGGGGGGGGGGARLHMYAKNFFLDHKISKHFFFLYKLLHCHLLLYIEKRKPALSYKKKP